MLLIIYLILLLRESKRSRENASSFRGIMHILCLFVSELLASAIAVYYGKILKCGNYDIA